MQAGVEAFQQLGVKLRGLEMAEGRQDVEPDQVGVALTGGVLQSRDLDPLLDRLADSDAGLRVLVLVDLSLEPRGGLLRRLVGRRGLQEVALLLGQRVEAGVDAGAVLAGGELLDVAAGDAADEGA